MLKVSAPFHCALMAPAAERLRQALGEIELADLAVPVVANVDGEPNSDVGRVKELLVAQVTSTVRWQESIEKLAGMGVTRAFELGSGSVLRGLVRRIVKGMDPGIAVTSVGEPNEVNAIAAS